MEICAESCRNGRADGVVNLPKGCDGFKGCDVIKCPENLGSILNVMATWGI